MIHRNKQIVFHNSISQLLTNTIKPDVQTKIFAVHTTSMYKKNSENCLTMLQSHTKSAH